MGALAGWPLLPVEGGQAYALPALVEGGGSRLLELSGVGAELGRALRRAGCLGLDARVSRAHPALSEAAHAPSPPPASSSAQDQAMREALARVRHLVAIGSGKGGVGKGSVGVG